MINIIIPSYNCSKTLYRTLSSLITQTDGNFNVTIIDDSSTENITDTIKEFEDRLAIKYIRNDVNIGCGMSRQVGIDSCEDDYFCFLDSDDMFMPYTIEIFNAMIDENPEVELIYGDLYEQIEVECRTGLILRKENRNYCAPKLYKTEAIRKYDIRNSPEVKYSDDSYFNSMCFELLNSVYVGLPLYLYTNTKDSIIRSGKHSDDELMKDFINAMILSSKHILKYKDRVEHLKQTIANISESRLNDICEDLLHELSMLDRMREVNSIA